MNQNMRNIDWNELSQASSTLVLGNYARDMEQVVYGQILDCINQGGKVRVLSFNNRLGALCNALNGSYFKPTMSDLTVSSLLGGFQEPGLAKTHASTMIFHELGPMDENTSSILSPYVSKAIDLAFHVSGESTTLGDVSDAITYLANKSHEADSGLRDALVNIAAFLHKSLENGYVFWHGQSAIPDGPCVMYDVEYLLGNIPATSAFILSFLLRSVWDAWTPDNDAPRLLVLDDIWKLKSVFPSQGVACGVIAYLLESSTQVNRALLTTFGSQSIAGYHTLDHLAVIGTERKIFAKSLCHDNISAVTRNKISPSIVAGISSQGNEFIMLMVDRTIDPENPVWLSLNLGISQNERAEDTMTAASAV